MGTDNFDPERYKAGERQTWDAVAAGWNRWWTTFEPGAQILSDHLIELAAISPGPGVLDVATGIGEPAFTASRRVRPTGSVVAIDQAPQMLAIAAERATMLAGQPVQKQLEVHGEIAKAVGQFAAVDGQVSLPNEAICVVGGDEVGQLTLS